MRNRTGELPSDNDCCSVYYPRGNLIAMMGNWEAVLGVSIVIRVGASRQN